MCKYYIYNHSKNCQNFRVVIILGKHRWSECGALSRYRMIGSPAPPPPFYLDSQICSRLLRPWIVLFFHLLFCDNTLFTQMEAAQQDRGEGDHCKSMYMWSEWVRRIRSTLVLSSTPRLTFNSGSQGTAEVISGERKIGNSKRLKEIQADLPRDSAGMDSADWIFNVSSFIF